MLEVGSKCAAAKETEGGWKGRCFGGGVSVTSGGVPPFYERGAVRVVVVFKDLGECADGAISLD